MLSWGLIFSESCENTEIWSVVMLQKVVVMLQKVVDARTELCYPLRILV
jgi:hypothetical protein